MLMLPAEFCVIVLYMSYKIRSVVIFRSLSTQLNRRFTNYYNECSLYTKNMIKAKQRICKVYYTIRIKKAKRLEVKHAYKVIKY